LESDPHDTTLSPPSPDPLTRHAARHKQKR
jgi:hypothetical protein